MMKIIATQVVTKTLPSGHKSITSGYERRTDSDESITTGDEILSFWRFSRVKHICKLMNAVLRLSEGLSILTMK